MHYIISLRSQWVNSLKPGEWCHHCLRQRLIATLVLNHYLKQRSLIANREFGSEKKLHWQFNKSKQISSQENAFKMSSAKCRPFCFGLDVFNADTQHTSTEGPKSIKWRHALYYIYIWYYFGIELQIFDVKFKAYMVYTFLESLS